jgi:dTDP-4-amino-4,6-dideoxygalactose transaminase
MPSTKEELRQQILDLVHEYHRAAFAPKPFSASPSAPVAGRIFDARELQNLVDASLDFWLTDVQAAVGVAQLDKLPEFIRRRRENFRLLYDGLSDQGLNYRVVGELPNSDWVMNQVFWIGVYPGLDAAHVAHQLDAIHQFSARVPA